MFSVFIPGIPRPKGSTRPFIHPHTKRIVVVQASKYLRDWEKNVYQQFRHMWTKPPRQFPAVVHLNFFLQRPKKPSYEWPMGPPDADKLARGVVDALTGIVWTNDSCMVDVFSSKRWTSAENPTPGVNISVSELS